MEECVMGLVAVRNFGSKRVLREIVVKRSDILGCERNSWRLFGGATREVILWGFLWFTLL